MEQFITSPSVRIRPPSAVNGKSWSIEILNEKTLWRVPEVAIVALMLARRPVARTPLIIELKSRTKLPENTLSALADFLISRNVLVDHKSAVPREGVFSLEFWQDVRAPEAGDYFLATFDYPFLNFSETGDGYQIQRQRMFDYSSESPDTSRYKDDYQYSTEIKLPGPHEARIDRRAEFQDNMLAILSLTLLQTGSKSVPWTEAPLIRRTSPSGGSRHPTEGYLVQDGEVYHVNTKHSSLRKIGRTDYFLRITRPSSAIVILTCVFERNSFRYREPRTFRTVHMDAGHLLGTMELLSDKAALEFVTLDIGDNSRVQEMLSIDGRSEFFVSACTFGQQRSII